MTDVYLESQWSDERLSDSEGLVRGRRRCDLTLFYDFPVRGGSVITLWKILRRRIKVQLL